MYEVHSGTTETHQLHQLRIELHSGKYSL